MADSNPISGYLDALRRRWGLAVIGGATVVAVVVPFAVGLPDLYRASAKILVEGQASSPILQAAAEGEAESRLQAIKQEALSRARLTDLVNRFNLYPDARRTGSMDDAIAQLQKDIKLTVTSTVGTATVAFELSYVGRNSAEVANVANAVATFYVTQNSNIRARQATGLAGLLKQQLDDTKQTLDEQEQKVAGFRARNAGAMPQELNTNLAMLARAQNSLDTNRTEQVRTRQRKQDLQFQLSNLGATVAAGATAANDPQVQLRELEGLLTRLLAQFGEGYPSVPTTRQQISDLKAKIASNPVATATPDPRIAQQRATLEKSIADTDADISRLAGEEINLRDQVAGYTSRVERAPVRDSELDKLLNDQRATRAIFDQFQTQYYAAVMNERAQQGQVTEQFKILDAAQPPRGPAGPNRQLLFILAGVLAVVVGLGLVIVMEGTDSSFHSIDDLRAFTRVPVIGSIPPIVTRSDTTWRLIRLCAYATMASIALGVMAAGAFHFAKGGEAIARILLRVS